MMENLTRGYQNNLAPKDKIESELLLNEHTSGRNAVLKVIEFCSVERNGIIEKIKKLKTNTLYREDIETLQNLLKNRIKHFEDAWTARQKQLNDHLESCQYAAELKQTMGEVDELSVAIRTKLTIGDSIASIKSLDTELSNVKKHFVETEARVENCFSFSPNKLIP